MGILERIAEIEHEINRTQKNKGSFMKFILERKNFIYLNLFLKLPSTIWVC